MTALLLKPAIAPKVEAARAELRAAGLAGRHRSDTGPAY
jgi:hypothetical protein